MSTLKLEGIGRSEVFGNNVCIVNTTPHPITIEDVDGVCAVVPTTVLVNAEAVEEKVDELFVKTRFIGTDEGIEIIKKIEDAHAATTSDSKLVIIGSIIAAQAYPGKVVAMVPVPGYERVTPGEKRMRCDKFTVFDDVDSLLKLQKATIEAVKGLSELSSTVKDPVVTRKVFKK